jgi:hypothetical protein
MPKIACKHCKLRKDEEEYAITADDKLDIYCMACRLKEMDGEVLGPKTKEVVVKVVKEKKVKLTDEEKRQNRLVSNKLWRQKNRVKMRAYHRKYYHENKEYRERMKKAQKPRAPEQIKRYNKKRDEARFNNPIRYCNSCLKHMSKDKFSLKTPTKWHYMCDECRDFTKFMMEK